MKSLVFEGKTWEVYETLRQQDKEQHKQLCKIIKEMMRNDPRVGIRFVSIFFFLSVNKKN